MQTFFPTLLEMSPLLFDADGAACAAAGSVSGRSDLPVSREVGEEVVMIRPSVHPSFSVPVFPGFQGHRGSAGARPSSHRAKKAGSHPGPGSRRDQNQPHSNTHLSTQTGPWLGIERATFFLLGGSTTHWVCWSASYVVKVKYIPEKKELVLEFKKKNWSVLSTM